METAGGPPAALPNPPLLQDGLELELAAYGAVRLYHLEAGHGVVVDIAVLVEAPLPVDAVEVLGGGDGLAHGLPLVGDGLGLVHLGRRPADGVDDDAPALRGIEGVGGRLLAEPRLVPLVGLGPHPPHLLEGQAGEGD